MHTRFDWSGFVFYIEQFYDLQLNFSFLARSKLKIHSSKSVQIFSSLTLKIFNQNLKLKPNFVDHFLERKIKWKKKKSKSTEAVELSAKFLLCNYVVRLLRFTELTAPSLSKTIPFLVVGEIVKFHEKTKRHNRPSEQRRSRIWFERNKMYR